MRALLMAQARFDSPLGPLTAGATEHGIAGLWFDGQAHHPGPLDAPVDPGHRWLLRLRRALDAYWSGARTFDVPLDLHGTPFQRGVWQALLGIDSGRTCSYGQLARQLGTPTALRAVGAAIGKNPVSVIVPCHRVIGHGGALTGYAGGVERKRALLALEGAIA